MKNVYTCDHWYSKGLHVGTHRGIHGVRGESPCDHLADAGQEAAGAECHEGNVQVRRIDILARREIFVAASNLRNTGSQACD